MALYLDKKEERDLKILEILYSEERWWTGEELSNRADCSFDSALKSIETLTHLAPDLNHVYSIESQKNRGSYLVAMPNCSYSRIESLYYRHTTTYQIIDRIFQEQDLTMEQLIDDLFISKSTLYRKLKIIEEIFAENNLKLNKSTLTIEGSEWYIREFYYVFYWSLVQTENWPFRYVRLEIIDYRISELISQNRMNLSAIEKIQLSYRLSINFIRHQKKLFIQTIPTDVRIDDLRKEYFYEISEVFNQNVPPTFQEREILYLCLMLTTYPYLHEDTSVQNFKPIVDWYKNNNTLTYQLTHDLIEALCKIYSNPKLTKQLKEPRVLFLLFSAANYAILFPQLTSYENISRNWKKVLVYFEKENPMFYHNLYSLMVTIQGQEQYRERVMPPGYSFFTLYNIFNYCLDISSFEEAISIKLISAENPVSELSLAHILKQQINHHLVVSTSQTRNDENHLYDMLISDFALPNALKPLAQTEYIWENPPTDRDLATIRTILDDLSQTKKA